MHSVDEIHVIYFPLMIKIPITLITISLLFPITANAKVDIAHLKGSAQIMRNNQLLEAERRMNVKEGDTVITSKDETVDIRWGSFWACRILANTKVSIQKIQLRNL